MIEYKVIEQPDRHSLEIEVRRFISWGFKPTGGISVVAITIPLKDDLFQRKYRYTQAVVKESGETTETIGKEKA